jgi:hypothetical protein
MQLLLLQLLKLLKALLVAQNPTVAAGGIAFASHLCRVLHLAALDPAAAAPQ